MRLFPVIGALASQAAWSAAPAQTTIQIRQVALLIPNRPGRPSTSMQARGGLLYDVVNRKGEVFERVQLPPFCALAGFGVRGTIYLSCPVENSTRLQRTYVVRNAQ